MALLPGILCLALPRPAPCQDTSGLDFLKIDGYLSLPDVFVKIQ